MTQKSQFPSQSKHTKKVLFACGGTGGHVFPAIAIAQDLQKKGWTIAFTGRAKSMEERLVRPHFDFYSAPAHPLVRGGLWQNFTLPFRFIHSLIQASQVLKASQADVVIGTGGYVSLPAILVAGIQKLPVYLQEQNAVAGIANKIGAKFAKAVFVSGSAAASSFAHPEIHPFGTPVREISSQNIGIKPELYQSYDKVVMIVGGSQGARGINTKLRNSLEKMGQRTNTLWFWQAGKRELDLCKSEAAAYKNIIVTDFIDNIYQHMAHADVIISRSGASTLAEILLLGKTSVLIPFPYATANHQEANARAVEMCGACVVELESEPNNMIEKVLTLLDNSELNKQMAEKAQNLGRPEAAQKIADYIHSQEVQL